MIAADRRVQETPSRLPQVASKGASSVYVTSGGLMPGVALTFVCACAAIVWKAGFSFYYELSSLERAFSGWHSILRASAGAGLFFGIVSTTLVLANLAYPLRRRRWVGISFGALRKWESVHMASGIITLTGAVLHGGFRAQSASGGNSLVVLAVICMNGALFRFLGPYSRRALLTRSQHAALQSFLSGARFAHKWLAALLVLLLGLHIISAIRYSQILSGGIAP